MSPAEMVSRDMDMRYHLTESVKAMRRALALMSQPGTIPDRRAVMADVSRAREELLKVDTF